MSGTDPEGMGGCCGCDKSRAFLWGSAELGGAGKDLCRSRRDHCALDQAGCAATGVGGAIRVGGADRLGVVRDDEVVSVETGCLDECTTEVAAQRLAWVELGVWTGHVTRVQGNDDIGACDLDGCGVGAVGDGGETVQGVVRPHCAFESFDPNRGADVLVGSRRDGAVWASSGTVDGDGAHVGWPRPWARLAGEPVAGDWGAVDELPVTVADGSAEGDRSGLVPLGLGRSSQLSRGGPEP